MFTEIGVVAMFVGGMFALSTMVFAMQMDARLAIHNAEMETRMAARDLQCLQTFQMQMETKIAVGAGEPREADVTSEVSSQSTQIDTPPMGSSGIREILHPHHELI